MKPVTGIAQAHNWQQLEDSLRTEAHNELGLSGEEIEFDIQEIKEIEGELLTQRKYHE